MHLKRNSHYYIATTDKGLVLGTIQDNSILPESEVMLKLKGRLISSWVEQGLIVSRVDAKSLVRAIRLSSSLLSNDGQYQPQKTLALIPRAEDFSLTHSELL